MEKAFKEAPFLPISLKKMFKLEEEVEYISFDRYPTSIKIEADELGALATGIESLPIIRFIKEIELVKVSFNLRVSYSEACRCVDEIKKLGGDGNIVVGGSWYKGTDEQINGLIDFMGKNNIDLDSMSIDKSVEEARQERIQKLRDSGTIK